MLTLRRSEERGHARHGWLDSYHSFSFANYFDPEHMGFRTLRVINEDRVAPSRGFGTHPHDNMEIVTYVVSGALSHRDSMGSESTLQAGDVQAMSAGTGITHSEYNGSAENPVHLLQIWIEPARLDVAPTYAEKNYPRTAKLNTLLPIVGTASEGLKLNQDATIYASVLEKDHRLNHELKSGRHAWVQVISGALAVNGETLHPGDAAAISDEKHVELKAEEEAEFLVFDLN